MNELALFAGAGGGIIGGKLLGWRTVCAVEINAYCAGVLVQRQNDGVLAPFPIWDDVRTFDGNPWRGIIDVVSGGFPCQDISAAGRGAGIDGERSGLWQEMARIIGEVRPRFAFVENSPMLTSRGLGRVLGDLAEMGYNARWGIISAADVGAPHLRERIWIVAYTNCIGMEEWSRKDWKQTSSEGIESRYEAWRSCSDLADSNGSSGEGYKRSVRIGSEYSITCGTIWWKAEPDVDRVADGVAFRVDRIKAIGNGQVPSVARLAWEILTEGL